MSTAIEKKTNGTVEIEIPESAIDEGLINLSIVRNTDAWEEYGILYLDYFRIPDVEILGVRNLECAQRLMAALQQRKVYGTHVCQPAIDALRQFNILQDMWTEFMCTTIKIEGARGRTDYTQKQLTEDK